MWFLVGPVGCTVARTVVGDAEKRFDEDALRIMRAIRFASQLGFDLDDETKEIAKEIVRNDALDRVFIATDYFDASINRIAAWVTGVRSVQKALLFALLQPDERLKRLQRDSNFTEIMYLQEEMKTAPFGDVWREYLEIENVPADYLSEVRKYEEEVLVKRV